LTASLRIVVSVRLSIRRSVRPSVS